MPGHTTLFHRGWCHGFTGWSRLAVRTLPWGLRKKEEGLWRDCGAQASKGAAVVGKDGAGIGKA